ncbi:MAG: hypothetical protein SLAVMIC_00271 [uncultured marine phage]|uniref:Uncharacterized protein n=1 Tax=uncultured marine phage TaxID=707152 RepID=A0A8D9CBT3_9VIRU|nr:MAG: hypothetical protein SLAVMIC_00271 [uncultured marine phage]
MTLHILLIMLIMGGSTILYFLLTKWYDKKFRPSFVPYDIFERSGPYFIIGVLCVLLMFGGVLILNDYFL